MILKEFLARSMENSKKAISDDRRRNAVIIKKIDAILHWAGIAESRERKRATRLQ